MYTAERESRVAVCFATLACSSSVLTKKSFLCVLCAFAVNLFFGDLDGE